MIRKIIILVIMAGLFSCAPQRELSTMQNVNLNQYAGTWYEIARLPNTFEKGLECVSATYTVKEDGKIGVLNQGTKSDGKQKSINGKAWRPYQEREGVLKVSFFWPFAGDYYIIELDESYQVALVGSPSRKYLWILARSKELDPKIIEKYKAIAKEKGFDTSKLTMVVQDC